MNKILVQKFELYFFLYANLQIHTELTLIWEIRRKSYNFMRKYSVSLSINWFQTKIIKFVTFQYIMQTLLFREYLKKCLLENTAALMGECSTPNLSAAKTACLLSWPITNITKTKIKTIKINPTDLPARKLHFSPQLTFWFSSTAGTLVMRDILTSINTLYRELYFVVKH